MKKSTFLFSLLVFPCLSAGTTTITIQETNNTNEPRNSPPETAEEMVWNTRAFKSYLTKKEQYTDIEKEAQKREGYEEMGDREKEQVLLEVYHQKLKKTLRSIASNLLIGYFFGFFFFIILSGLVVFTPVLFVLKKIFQRTKEYWGNKDPTLWEKFIYLFIQDPKSSTKPKKSSSVITEVIVRGASLFEHLNNFLDDKNLPNNNNSSVSTTNTKKKESNWLSSIRNSCDDFIGNFLGSGVVTLGIGLFALRYAQGPITHIFKMVKNIWRLIKFIYNPFYEDPARDPEELFVKSLYLFDETQKMHMTSLLISVRTSDPTLVNEAYQFIAMQRAIPQGIKTVKYDQAAIDEVFANYPTETKELAEQIIATIVIYTNSIQSDREDLVKMLPLKGILLLGGPGIGKSHFMKSLGKATGLPCVRINLAGNLEREIKGEAGNSIGKGHPSAYAKALFYSADEHGRVYKNSILIFEEADKFAGSPHVIDFLHRLLDPREQDTRDEYLHMNLQLLYFRFCTSNYDFDIPAIKDRFIVYNVKGITLENKKKIIQNNLAPMWVKLLASPDLENEYGQLDPEECTALLEGKLVDYINNHTEELGMRGIEEEAWKVASKLLVEEHKKRLQAEKEKEEREKLKNIKREALAT